MNCLRFVTVVPALILVASACGKKSSGSKSDSSAPKTAALRVGVLSLSSAESQSLALASPPTVSDFHPNSITSGAPDTLKMKIARMQLRSTSGKTTTIFDDPAGKEIRIDGSHVDLSSLFTKFACLNSSGEPVNTGGVACPCGLDANNAPVAQVGGVCPKGSAAVAPAVGEIPIAPDTYNSLTVTFMRGAKISGCVSGNFNSTNIPSGTHTYCTRSAFSTFKTPVGGMNSDFENQSPEEMDFDLRLSNSLAGSPTDTMDFSFPISGNIAVNNDQPQRLTMVIDTNRLLRFFNQGRTDSGPNPGLPADRSYFFTTVFSGSVFVFTGAPGEIRGYSFATNACANGSKPFPVDHVCTSNPFTVAGWMTMVFDSAGKPMVVNIMPDDDNTLTVLKGGNMSKDGLDYSAFASAGANKWNVSANLGTEGSQTIFNVPTDIAVGAEVTDVYFEGLQSSYGTVRLTRGL